MSTASIKFLTDDKKQRSAWLSEFLSNMERRSADKPGSVDVSALSPTEFLSTVVPTLFPSLTLSTSRIVTTFVTWNMTELLLLFTALQRTVVTDSFSSQNPRQALLVAFLGADAAKMKDPTAEDVYAFNEILLAVTKFAAAIRRTLGAMERCRTPLPPEMQTLLGSVAFVEKQLNIFGERPEQNQEEEAKKEDEEERGAPAAAAAASTTATITRTPKKPSEAVLVAQSFNSFGAAASASDALSKLNAHPTLKQDLLRFVKAQEGEDDEVTFPTALAELENGSKESCWIWYVLPAMLDAGKKGSDQTKFFQLHNQLEVVGFILHPVLGPRIAKTFNVIRNQLCGAQLDPTRLMGWSVDAKKLHQSATSFSLGCESLVAVNKSRDGEISKAVGAECWSGVERMSADLESIGAAIAAKPYDKREKSMPSRVEKLVERWKNFQPHDLWINLS